MQLNDGRGRGGGREEGVKGKRGRRSREILKDRQNKAMGS